jgi:hypothetical protein
VQRGRRLKNAAIVEINLNSLAEAQKARHIVRAIAEHSNTICFAVTSAEGETRPAADWIGMGGRPGTLRDGFVTADGYQVGTVVCVHAKDMKEPWAFGCQHHDRKAIDDDIRKTPGMTPDSAIPRTYALEWGWLRSASARQNDEIGFGY